MNWQAIVGICASAAALVLGAMRTTPTYAADKWFPFPVEVWENAFQDDSTRKKIDYTPLGSAAKKWRICVSFPHLKDAYWLAVNFGVVEEAKRLGVAMDLYEAGGYDNLDRQITQIRKCLADRPNGVIISAISKTGLNDLIRELAATGVPAIDLVNGIGSPSIAARSAVFFGDMGYAAGRYVVGSLVDKTKKVRVAWFPGPRDAAWVQAGDAGFRRAISGSNVDIVETRYGDTGDAAQSKLINEVLDKNSDIDFIIGTAVTAEAAVGILRSRKLNQTIKVMAYYYGPGVDRGIRRGTIMAAPTDLPAIQGRIAVDQIVRILEGKPVLKHVGPEILVVDAARLKDFDPNTSLAPVGFKVVFNVN